MIRVNSNYLTVRRMVLENAVAVSSGKGGAGKTTLAAHLAGHVAAEEGRRVLLVDLDPHGTVSLDLGFWGSAGFDHGEALAAAILGGAPLRAPPLRDVRPGLDVVPSGDYTLDVALALDGPADALATALGELAAGYDLVILDTPPATGVEARLALAAAHGVVVPTVADDSGRRAIQLLARTLDAVREVNPALTVLGAVLFRVAAAATRVAAKAVKNLGAFEDLRVFEPPIRDVYALAWELRAAGRLASEYVKEARAAQASRLRALSSRDVSGARRWEAPDPRRVQRLAGDYQLVCAQIVAATWDLMGVDRPSP